MTIQQRASKGGRATLAKYGRSHFQDLARRWHEKYSLKKYGRNDFLIIERSTGRINAKTLNGARYDPRQK